MIHDSAADGYRQQANTYADARPSYHPSLVERVVALVGGGVVVDLGAGTGIFTSQLVGAGVVPIAIEPVDAMRAQLMAANPTVAAIAGSAEATGLDNNSVDSVVVAQAFHWFDHKRALTEIRRILRPGGHLVCVWNVRDDTSEFMRAFTSLMDAHAGDTPRAATMDWRRAIDDDPAFKLIDDWSIPNPVDATPDAVVGRALSTSFIAALDKETQDGVLDQVRALARQQGDSFLFPYRSELQAWTMVG